MLTQAGFAEPALFGKQVHVLSRQPARDQQNITRLLSTNHIAVSSIRQSELSMEDVFVYWVRELEQQAQKVASAA